MKLLILVPAIIMLPLQHTFCQSNPGSFHLPACFGQQAKDSFEVEIKGFGNVLMHSLSSDTTEDMGLTWYFIPEKHLSRNRQKTAQLAAKFQVDTWKNNSRIVSSKQIDDGQVTIIDTRLHLLIENIYFQSVIFCDGSMVYEIDSFSDQYDKAFFDRVTEKLAKRNCPY